MKKSLKKNNNKSLKKHTKKTTQKPKFIILSLDLLRKKYLNGEKKIKYYYADGGNPNKMSKPDLDKYVLSRDYYFIPNGNLIISETNWKDNKYNLKKTKIENFLGDNFDKKKVDYLDKSNDIFYSLEGKHILDKSPSFDSQMIICSRPRFSLSDNCIGGPNWIKI